MNSAENLFTKLEPDDQVVVGGHDQKRENHGPADLVPALETLQRHLAASKGFDAEQEDEAAVGDQEKRDEIDESEIGVDDAEEHEKLVRSLLETFAGNRGDPDRSAEKFDGKTAGKYLPENVKEQ